MSEKNINDDEDEITYRTTDFLADSDINADSYKSRRSGGILIFFVVLILSTSCFSGLTSISLKNNEIKALNKSLLLSSNPVRKGRAQIIRLRLNRLKTILNRRPE